MPKFTVVKNQKRLFIVNEDNEQVYTPPNFMKDRLPNRDVLQELADYWNEFGYDIKTIIDFEAKWQKKKPKGWL